MYISGPRGKSKRRSNGAFFLFPFGFCVLVFHAHAAGITHRQPGGTRVFRAWSAIGALLRAEIEKEHISGAVVLISRKEKSAYFWVDPQEKMFVVYMMPAAPERNNYRHCLRNLVYQAIEN